jgi:hypothetical protein
MKLQMLNLAVVTLSVVTVLAQAVPEKAEAGDGTKAGEGVFILAKGAVRPFLRDFVDKGVCERKTLKDLAVLNPHFTPVMTELKRRSWYVGALYMTELERLPVCIVRTPLKKVIADDPESEQVYFYTAPIGVKQQTIAARQDDEKSFASQIYLFWDLYKQMPEDHQLGLLMHEVTHSFIPETANRNQKVREQTLAVMTPNTQVWSADLAINSEAEMAPYRGILEQGLNSASEITKGAAFASLVLLQERSVSTTQLTDFERTLIEFQVGAIWKSLNRSIINEQNPVPFFEFAMEIRDRFKKDPVSAMKALDGMIADAKERSAEQDQRIFTKRVLDNSVSFYYLSQRLIPLFILTNDLPRLQQYVHLMKINLEAEYHSLDLRQTMKFYEYDDLYYLCGTGDQALYVRENFKCEILTLRVQGYAKLTPLVDSVRYQKPEITRWLLSRNVSTRKPVKVTLRDYSSWFTFQAGYGCKIKYDVQSKSYFVNGQDSYCLTYDQASAKDFAVWEKIQRPSAEIDAILKMLN